MGNRLIIDGNSVYEIDEECLRNRQGKTLELKPARRNSAITGKAEIQGEKKQKNKKKAED